MSSKGVQACGNCKNKFTQSFTGSTSNKYYCTIKPSTRTKLGMELVKITQAKCVSYIYDPDGMKINQSNMRGLSPWKTGNFPEYKVAKVKRSELFEKCDHCGRVYEKQTKDKYCNNVCYGRAVGAGKDYKQGNPYDILEDVNNLLK